MARSPASVVADIPQHVACAHMACDRRATIRQSVGKGWANLCHGHYLDHHARIAERKLEERGLQFFPDSETREEWHRRLLAFMKSKPVTMTMPDAPGITATAIWDQEAA